jgi:hypothetical protein
VQLGGTAMGGLAKREPVLAAWGFTLESRRVLLHLMAGSKEDAETVHELSHRVVHVNRNSPVVLRAELCFTISLMRT